MSRVNTDYGMKLTISRTKATWTDACVMLKAAKGTDFLDGFSFEDCSPVFGDGTDLKISWKGSTIPDPIKGKMMELRLLLKDATLYSVLIEQK